MKVNFRKRKFTIINYKVTAEEVEDFFQKELSEWHEAAERYKALEEAIT